MRKLNIKKEEVAEDYCFVCKDGGLLLICEYKHCLKAYHPECVGKDDTFLETGERWMCSWHSCFICNKKPKFHCFCCPNAVCQRCINVAEFVQVRGKKGFCNNCLKLALLIEENVDIDSDGGKVDFKDRETCEFLFMEYWEIVKAKEHLKLETLHLANNLLKKGDKYRSESDSDCEKMDGKIEDGKLQWMEEPEGQKYFSMKMLKRKVRSKKKEFIGWGSRPLIEFLASIGIDTSKQFSQYEVNSIIREYVNKNNLMHPVRKKRVVCDERLQSVFGRKSINRNKIDDLLESHFSENMEESEEDEFKCSSEDMEEDASKACEKRRISSSERTHKRKKDLEVVPQSCFASVTPRNIKLVYLKRSLVECLLKSPETFEEKVVGSFVRVKCDPNDYLQRCSHKLLQVTGIKKASGTTDFSTEIFLQVSDVKKEICIRMLSDDNFPEEECDDLRQRVKDGLIKKPTIWVDREILSLQNLIERANEKGWRRELAEYLERKQLLQTPTERFRLLQEIPTIIAEEVEPEATPQDCPLVTKEAKDESPRSIIVGALGSSSENLAGNITVSTQMVAKTDTAGDGALYDWKSRKGGAGDQNSVLVQGEKHHACVAEHPHQLVKLDEQAINIACAAAKQRLQPIEVEESSRGKLLACNIIQQHQAIEVAAESSRQMQQLDVKEAGNRETQLQDHKPIDIAAEKQHDLLQVDEETSRGVQQQDNPTNVVAEGSTCGSLIPLTDVTEKEDQPIDVEHTGAAIVDLDDNDGNCTMVKRQRISAVQVVEVSDDDDEIPEDDRCPGNTPQNQNLEDPSRSIWHYVDPYNEVQGPFPMSALKRWEESNYFAPDFKVWKTGQSMDEAVLLTDALGHFFPMS
ncbi:zinc finger CCCH domain-containing protein 44-like isoform X2 [Telopea speciosissima]|uniref:zinc finger CCCH domain-containing protein 44-like isoform X2 n=1 Tax=Telopea speciosissima TaxID=54955 RepID=UPI001CC81B7D|nr:zinc finger CCCH domain-containing protein 44-like isoform X2 [Telopea speciosissima]